MKPLTDASDSIPFDGIILHLHGAMVTVSQEDAEGELLERIRQTVGVDVPIIVTLDLHGNITKKMASNASCLIAVRTYPHIDFYERAWDAGELLQKCMKKQVKPVTVIAKKAMLKGLDGGRTHDGSPMKELIDRGVALELACDNKVLVVSICAGFTAADIHDIGPSVTVTMDSSSCKDQLEVDIVMQSGQEIADIFMNYVWEQRNYSSVNHLSVPAVMELILTDEVTVTAGPLVVADVTDNPGSGHYGDATNFLKALIDSEAKNVVFYAMYDPIAVSKAIEIGIGNSGTIEVGGRHDPNVGGSPLQLTGVVVTLSNGCFPSYGVMGGGVWQNMGLSCLFRVGEVDVIIISNNGQLLDLAQITSLGIDPIHKNVVALKSNHHFRASCATIARKIVTIDGGGLGSAILKGGNYVNVRRPIWPLDGDNF